MKARLFLIALFVLNIFQMSAQSNDEVTLVVSADGATKEEATKVALRSAIEQAYGTFVSANTTILNDEMVKDEIVSISNGNIKSFSEISSNILQDGRTFVTLQATVSLVKLTKYAQSKGATTEFAGATFAMDMKMKELNKRNEIIVLQHMANKLHMIRKLFDYKLELEEPQVCKRDDRYPKDINNPEEYYKVKGKIILYYNKNTDMFNDILNNTIQAISLTFEDKEEYDKKGLELYRTDSPAGNLICLRNNYYRLFNEIPNTFDWNSPAYYIEKIDRREKTSNESPIALYKDRRLYHDGRKDCWEWGTLAKDALTFSISDNISTPTKLPLYVRHLEIEDNVWAYTATKKENFWTSKQKVVFKKTTKIGDKVGEMLILIMIPKKEIGNYSLFEIK